MIAKRPDGRHAHRVEVLGDLHLEILDEKTRFNGDAMNLSANGINFLSLLRLPLFREVDVHLKLPLQDQRTRVAIHCHGVVVRCDKMVEPFFEISLYFVDLADHDKNKVRQYMDRVAGHRPLGPR